jgi:enterobacteria phage integrase
LAGPVTSIRLRYVHGYRDRHGVFRYYVRRRGFKRVPLPGLPGDQEFMKAYHAALGHSPVKRESKGGPRSLSALIASFKASPQFKNRSAGTQKAYRHVLKHIEAKDGHRSAVDLPEDKARKIIEEIGEDRPALANLTCAVMRQLFKHAIKIKWRSTNPFLGIEGYKIGKHHTWTDEEFAQYEAFWPVGTRERLAYDALYYTIQRVGDVAAIKRADVVKGEIPIVQQKTGTALTIPVHPALRRSMIAYGIKGQHLVGFPNGRQMNGDQLSKFVIDAAQKAGLPRECVPHGIRKGVMRQLAEGGESTKRIASLSGHKTLKEIERYIEAADQGRMARIAIEAIPDRRG